MCLPEILDDYNIAARSICFEFRYDYECVLYNEQKGGILNVVVST